MTFFAQKVFKAAMDEFLKREKQQEISSAYRRTVQTSLFLLYSGNFDDSADFFFVWLTGCKLAENEIFSTFNCMSLKSMSYRSLQRSTHKGLVYFIFIVYF